MHCLRRSTLQKQKSVTHKCNTRSVACYTLQRNNRGDLNAATSEETFAARLAIVNYFVLCLLNTLGLISLRWSAVILKPSQLLPPQYYYTIVTQFRSLIIGYDANFNPDPSCPNVFPRKGGSCLQLSASGTALGGISAPGHFV